MSSCPAAIESVGPAHPARNSNTTRLSAICMLLLHVLYVQCAAVCNMSGAVVLQVARRVQSLEPTGRLHLTDKGLWACGQPSQQAVATHGDGVQYNIR